MTTELDELKASQRLGPIIPEVLWDLPLGGIYVHSSAGVNSTVRLDSWSGATPCCSIWCVDHWDSPDEVVTGLFSYPRIDAVTMTAGPMKTHADTISGRQKYVTRRKKRPGWAQPGRLFNAWDRSFRVGKGKARGLGTFRVSSAVRQGRYACNSCHGILEKRYGQWICPQEPSETVDLRVDNLYPTELAAEGFPDMPPDDFWALLEKAGNVAEDGTVCRIEFAAV